MKSVYQLIKCSDCNKKHLPEFMQLDPLRDKHVCLDCADCYDKKTFNQYNEDRFDR